MSSDDIFFGVSSSSAGQINKDGKKCVNLQLAAWKDAKEKYFDILNKNQFDIAQVKLIIQNLGQSLCDLFGANYNKPGRTPYLKDYIDKILPTEKTWDLKTDNLRLYNNFLKLNDYYTDKTKHYDANKNSFFINFTINDLKEMMETTKNIWLWFIKKQNNNIEQIYLIEFNDDFV